MCFITFIGQLLPSLPSPTKSGTLILRSSIPFPTRRYTCCSYQWGRSFIRHPETRSYQCGRGTSLTFVMHHCQRRRDSSRNGLRQRDYHSSLLCSFSAQAIPIPPRFHAFSHLQHVFQYYIISPVRVLCHRHSAHIQIGSISAIPQRRRIANALNLNKPTRTKHQSRW